MTWRHFTLEEFECNCGCSGNQIDPAFVNVLEHLRNELGLPMIVSSGYRCPAYNDRVSRTGHNGPHTTGKAADIRIMGHDAFMLLQCAFQSRRVSGIGINQKGPHAKRFIHLDCVSPELAFRPTVWSY